MDYFETSVYVVDDLVALSLDECSIGILTSCLSNTHNPA